MNCSRKGKKKVNSFKKATENTELILRARAINLKTILYKLNEFDFSLQQKYIHMYTTYRLVLYLLHCPLTCLNEMLVSVNIKKNMKEKGFWACKFKFHLNKTSMMWAEQSWMDCFFLLLERQTLKLTLSSSFRENY